MSARSIAKFTVKFGKVVSFAAKAYVATDDPGDATTMRQLHGACGTPIHRHDHCDKCNADVAFSDIVKGVDNGDGTFTVLTKEELDSIKPESSDVIEIESFVNAADIDSIYVRTTNYITPDGKAALDAYALLSALCASENVAGQGQWTVRGREHNVIIRIVNGTLAVQTMRTVNEVRDPLELPGFVANGAVTLKAEVMSIGKQLVKSMMGTFDATEYEDSFAKDFAALVAAKKSGAVNATPKLTPKQTAAASDLLSALKESLKDKPAKRAKVAKPSTGSGPKSTKGKGKASEATA